jgi:hypothetical protein
MKKICKDMLTTCPVAAYAGSAAAAANAAAAPDNVIPDPTRDATPSGTPHCKNVGTTLHA